MNAHSIVESWSVCMVVCLSGTCLMHIYSYVFGWHGMVDESHIIRLLWRRCGHICASFILNHRTHPKMAMNAIVCALVIGDGHQPRPISQNSQTHTYTQKSTHANIILSYMAAFDSIVAVSLTTAAWKWTIYSLNRYLKRIRTALASTHMKTPYTVFILIFTHHLAFLV